MTLVELSITYSVAQQKSIQVQEMYEEFYPSLSKWKKSTNTIFSWINPGIFFLCLKFLSPDP